MTPYITKIFLHKMLMRLENICSLPKRVRQGHRKPQNIWKTFNAIYYLNVPLFIRLTNTNNKIKLKFLFNLKYLIMQAKIENLQIKI